MSPASTVHLLPEEPPTDRATARVRRTGGRSRVNTRERLVEAAVDVFVSHGLKRVTVDDLTKAAGFTRGAFYSNFDSVDEVFYEAFRLRAQLLLTRAGDAVAHAGEIDLDFVLDLMQTMSADREWLVLQSEFSLLALRDEGARAILTEFTTQLRADLSRVIEEVLRRLGRRPTVATEQIVQVVVGLQNQIALAVALGNFDSAGTEQLARQVIGSLITEFSEPLES